MNIKSTTILIFLILIFQIDAVSIQNMHVCTVASHHNEQLEQLLHSGKDNQIIIDVLGLGLPYKGNGQKLSYVKEYLNRFSDDDIVLFVDAYDVLFLANTQTILDIFLNKKVSCIFAAELDGTNSWPLHYLANFYPPSPTIFKYLNSGTYIGYVGYLKKCFNDFEISEEISDQAQIALYYIHHQNEISLDYFCELFFPMVGFTINDITLDRKNRKIRCLTTASNPCIVHGNGIPEKHLYQFIYDELFSHSHN